MKGTIPLRFRPSLIIFVGKSGEDIRKQLELLLPGLEENLQQCVGLVQYGAGLSSMPISPAGSHFPAETPPEAQQSGSLADVLHHTLVNVKRERRRLYISDAAYPDSNAPPQIYIVGDAQASDMQNVLDAVHRELRDERTLTCYVLTVPDKQTIGSSGVQTQWRQYDVPNFCYLYEERSMHHTFFSPAEVSYAAAQSLFAFIATGITEAPGFQEATRREAITRYEERMGSMSTSMIRFPRATAETYCADQLGADIIHYWREGVNPLSDGERREQRQQAQETMRNIHEWIRDAEKRPGTAGFWGPSLYVLRQNQNQLNGQQLNLPDMSRYGRELARQSQRLFETFAFQSVMSEYRTMRRSKRRRRRSAIQTWEELVEDRAARAQEAYDQWNARATDAWRMATQRICEGVRSRVDALWMNNNNGLEMAFAYVTELGEQLEKLVEEAEQWRVKHARRYEDELERFDALADGEWVIPAGAPNFVGNNVMGIGMQLRPMVGARIVVQQPAVAANNTASPPVPAQASAAPPGPPEDEEDIAFHLGQRIGWCESQVPTVSNMVAAGAMVTAPLTLAGLALFPGVPASPVGGIATATAIAALLVPVNLVARKHYEREVMIAKKDLLDFYRLRFAYRCEMREDELRQFLLGRLNHMVVGMRTRLEDMQQFLKQIENDLRSHANQTVEELFRGPAGSRDIFIANGERLYLSGHDKDGQPYYTMEDFATRINQERRERPLSPCHGTYETIKPELLLAFQENHISIVDANVPADRIIDYVRTFMREEILHSYIQGDFVDIGNALDRPEVWEHVLRRAKTPLYRLHAGSDDPLFQFVSSCDSHLVRSEDFLPAQALAVYTANPEWLLVSSFFRGHASYELDADILFPQKSNGTQPQPGSWMPPSSPSQVPPGPGPTVAPGSPPGSVPSVAPAPGPTPGPVPSVSGRPTVAGPTGAAKLSSVRSQRKQKPTKATPASPSSPAPGASMTPKPQVPVIPKRRTAPKQATPPSSPPPPSPPVSGPASGVNSAPGSSQTGAGKSA